MANQQIEKCWPMGGAEEEKSGGSTGHGAGAAGKEKEGEVPAAATIPKEIHEVPPV